MKDASSRIAQATFAGMMENAGSSKLTGCATRIVVKAGNALRAGQMADSSIKDSRNASRIAGRMWTGWGRATRGIAKNGAPMRVNGTRTWRAPVRKGKSSSSNLTNSTQGRHDYFNFHIVHRKR